MQWMKKSDDGRITVAFLLERRIERTWQEAVGLVLELAIVLDLDRGVPRFDAIELERGGHLRLHDGSVQQGDVVSALAMTLGALVPADCPTQLRLLVATAGPEGNAYRSLEEFLEALRYFERPGRRTMLAEVYERALRAPIGDDADETTAPRSDGAPRSRRLRRWRWVAATVAAVVVGGGLMASASRAVGPAMADAGGWFSGTWAQMKESASVMQASARRDLAAVTERLQPETGAQAEGESTPAAAEATPVATSVPRTAPEVAPRAEVERSAEDDGVADRSPRPEVRGPSTAPLLTRPGGTPAAVEPTRIVRRAPVGPVYDESDHQVEPPVPVRTQLPPFDGARAMTGVVEAVVSPTGEVELVKLVEGNGKVHDAMMLSAIKTWRFAPAMQGGQAVRYRHRFEVATTAVSTLANREGRGE